MATDPRLTDAALTANEYLVDRAIRHSILIERFKSGLVRRIVGFMNDQLLPDILDKLESRLNRIASRGFDSGPVTTQRFRDLAAATDQVIQTGTIELARRTREELFGFASEEASWQARRMKAAFQGLLPLEFDFVTPSSTTLRSVVTSRPFQGKFLRDEWREMSTQAKVVIRDATRLGIAAGESTAQIVRRVRGTAAAGFSDGALNVSRRSAERIVRTAVNHVQAHARQAVFEANDDVVDKIILIATLDSRTSQICASLDGQVYPVHSGPRPPFHPNCRTDVAPVVKSFKELGIKGLKEVAPGERHAREVLGGKVPGGTTFGDWWGKLPTAKQNEIFGPGKADLLRSGKISFKQLIDQRQRPLTLRQLEALAESVAA